MACLIQMAMTRRGFVRRARAWTCGLLKLGSTTDAILAGSGHHHSHEPSALGRFCAATDVAETWLTGLWQSSPKPVALVPFQMRSARNELSSLVSERTLAAWIFNIGLLASVNEKNQPLKSLKNIWSRPGLGCGGPAAQRELTTPDARLREFPAEPRRQGLGLSSGIRQAAVDNPSLS